MADIDPIEAIRCEMKANEGPPPGELKRPDGMARETYNRMQELR